MRSVSKDATVQTAWKSIKIFIICEMHATQGLKLDKTFFLDFSFLISSSENCKQSRHLFSLNSYIWFSFLLECPSPCLLSSESHMAPPLGFHLLNFLLLSSSYMKGNSSNLSPLTPFFSLSQIPLPGISGGYFLTTFCIFHCFSQCFCDCLP